MHGPRNSGQLLGRTDGLFYGCESFIEGCGIWPTGLRHVRAAAAALAPKHCCTHFYQGDRIETIYEICGNADDKSSFTIRSRCDRYHA